MNETTSPQSTILHDNQNHSSRTVQLSAEFNTDAALHLTIAKFSDEGAQLVCMVQYAVPDEFHLTAAEMDALTTAWQTFLAEQQACQTAEARRRADDIAMASSLLDQHPEWSLVTSPCGEYRVYHAGNFVRRTVNSRESVLLQVKIALYAHDLYIPATPEEQTEISNDLAND